MDKGKNKIRLTKLEKINSHAGSIIHTLQKIKVEKYYKKREKKKWLRFNRNNIFNKSKTQIDLAIA